MPDLAAPGTGKNEESKYTMLGKLASYDANSPRNGK
jgi:hypothetical protein